MGIFDTLFGKKEKTNRTKGGEREGKRKEISCIQRISVHNVFHDTAHHPEKTYEIYENQNKCRRLSLSLCT
jgi:hypothetical protein